VKAFLTTRTGDIGLLTGVIMTFFVVQRATGVGSFNIIELNRAASNPKVGHTLILWCAAALMLAIVGKSGQFPLHTWLPDAMAGPTPVSALIHAATMVVAGVYLGARVFPVFFNGFSIGDGGINAMAAVGGITVLIGAALAFVQDDI
jgi:NADH-quinone oxidoreductase subunit L